jgi:chromosome segregation ATPase
MAQHTVADAAKLVNRDRRTLYKDIQRGRLTATVSATGERQVEPAELIRVYGELSVAEATTATVAERQELTAMATAHDPELAQLRAQVAALEARLADKQQHIEHLAQAMRLLEHRPATEPLPPRRSWWPFGRR